MKKEIIVPSSSGLRAGGLFCLSVMKRHCITVLFFCLIFHPVLFAQRHHPLEEFAPACDSISSFISSSANVGGAIAVDHVCISGNTLEIHFRPSIAEYPLRDSTLQAIHSTVRSMMPSKYIQYRDKFKLYCSGVSLDDLKSNAVSADPSSKFVKEHRQYFGRFHDKMSAPLVTPLSHPYKVTKGLENRHIALWQSHGWYYEQSLARWEWQRARIFETVEDLYTQSYVLPFLVPMLENAGANVLLPRERDWNTDEIIVDNDFPESGYSERGNWGAAPLAGFANEKSFYLDGENPFKMGTARYSQSSSSGECRAFWMPEFPREGEYAVYVSYQTLPKSSDRALYEVHHKGGVSRFSVNQRMGGGTWIYLGRFLFARGGAGQGVVLVNDSLDGNSSGAAPSKGSVVSADAVKFGGGMGNIARKPAEVDPDGRKIVSAFPMEAEVSGYPRFTEGSRYFLQWAGFNDSIYSPNKGMTDYNDDYQSRGKWVDILSDGSFLKPDRKGYNIPLDLSFAFHTDAGTVLDDGIIGTLAIYTRLSNGAARYPNKEQRVIAREYTDLVQSQIVSDIRSTYEPLWSRRGLWDRSYAESRSPEVPAMLLELLSHQNLADMRYGLDPSFRFTVSRAIYKGMLKYLAYINGFDYVVQPLPVNSFSALLSCSGGKTVARLQWKPTADTLEPSAYPQSYVLYTRIDDGGFDNGVAVDGTSTCVDIVPGRIYSFRITAVNEGGESFPSEILSVGMPSSNSLGGTLIVNNFTRVSAPSSFASPDSTFGGFQDFVDSGVPYLVDISYIGAMHEYRRNVPWMDDDAPGFGASYGDKETVTFAGNTFDYPYVHGKALLKAGYAFSSASCLSVMDGSVDLCDFRTVDLICGKQVTTQVGRKGACALKYRVFPAELQSAVRKFTSNGGNIIVSGADIATDIWDKVFQYDIDSVTNAGTIVPAKKFAQEVLGYKWMTNYASATGTVKAVQNPFSFSPHTTYSFHTTPNKDVYHVESPDALVPSCKNSFTIFRYADNDISAGVAFVGDGYRAVSLGFPIETLSDSHQIDQLMAGIMDFFNKRGE